MTSTPTLAPPSPVSTPSAVLKEVSNFNVADFEELLGSDHASWAQQCHAVSLQAAKALNQRYRTTFRVARGRVFEVTSQHSWLVLGQENTAPNCYDPNDLVLDLTLWSYLGKEITPVNYVDRAGAWPHEPQGGEGDIFEHMLPECEDGEIIELTPEVPFSPEARQFLNNMSELDLKGWLHLANAPVHGWPAREIFTAMYQTERIRPLIPVDIIGMATDLNPKGLYW